MREEQLLSKCGRKLSLAIICLLALNLWGQPTGTEYQIKAAYLLNFGKFVKWPSPLPGHSFSICVVGADPFGPVLDGTLHDEKIDGKPVVARRVSRPQDAAGCQVAFISRSEEAQVSKFIPILTKAGVLTVSDMPAFLDRGGMIQFAFAGNRIRFEVDLDKAQEAELTLSSELLKVASAVRHKHQAEVVK